MSFHDINLPKFMEVFAVCLPKFSVSIAETINGQELRNIDCEYAKQNYLLQDCRLSAAEFSEFNNFFYARRGSAYSFRFRDPLDHQANRQIIGVGDGKKTTFQLYKTYDDLVLPYRRLITKPIAEKIKIFIGEAEVNPLVDRQTGIITLDQVLPEDGKLIAEFEFDVEVRFNNDNFGYSYAKDGSIKLTDLDLIEVQR